MKSETDNLRKDQLYPILDDIRLSNNDNEMLKRLRILYCPIDVVYWSTKSQCNVLVHYSWTMSQG